jgi:peptide/nickel transport system substrate-binding protein
VVEDPGSKYSYLGVNFEDPILARTEVRRAMALAFDRQRLVDTLWRGLGIVTETVIPLGHWARNDDLEPIPYDPEAARRLLDKAGYSDPDGDGPQSRFALTYKTSTDETALLQAQIVQAMLAEVGIDIEIRSYEFATFYSDIKKGNFQVFSLTWTGIIDPDFFSLILHSKSIPPAGANRGRYRNQEFDRMVDEGARRTKLEDRRPFYLRAQEIMATDLPYISLFNRVNFAVMPVQLEGYQNYPSSELYSLKNVKWRR